jgi:uncharacterized protein YkwD
MSDQPPVAVPPVAVPPVSRISRNCAFALVTAALLLPSPLFSGGDPAGAGARFASVPVELALQMYEMINRDRTATSARQETKGRARPLRWDDRLADIARTHSEDMVQHGFFSHKGSDGSLPAARVSHGGIDWRAVGENIAEAKNIEEAEALFMNEPKFQQNHRGNILDPKFTRVGIGIVKAPDGTLYITQDFAQLP